MGDTCQDIEAPGWPDRAYLPGHHRHAGPRSGGHGPAWFGRGGGAAAGFTPGGSPVSSWPGPSPACSCRRPRCPLRFVAAVLGKVFEQLPDNPFTGLGEPTSSWAPRAISGALLLAIFFCFLVGRRHRDDEEDDEDEFRVRLSQCGRTRRTPRNIAAFTRSRPAEPGGRGRRPGDGADGRRLGDHRPMGGCGAERAREGEGHLRAAVHPVHARAGCRGRRRARVGNCGHRRQGMAHALARPAACLEGAGLGVGVAEPTDGQLLGAGELQQHVVVAVEVQGHNAPGAARTGSFVPRRAAPPGARWASRTWARQARSTSR